MLAVNTSQHLLHITNKAEDKQVNVQFPDKCLGKQIPSLATLQRHYCKLFPSYFGLVGFFLNGKEKDNLHVNPRKDSPLKISSSTLSPFFSYKTLNTSYSNHITKN